MKLLIWFAALLGAAASLPPAGGQALTNPGFEGAFKPVTSQSDLPSQKASITGDIAPGWEDNSNWADVGVVYSRDKSNPHRGQSSQKIAILRVNSGAVQFVQLVAFIKGRVNEFHVWLRGTPGTSVTLVLRKSGPPYTEYGDTFASLSPEWQEFRVAGVIPENTPGFLMVVAKTPMTFWVDDAGFLDQTKASSDAPARTGSLLPGGSFEAGLSYGWRVRYQGSMRNAFSDPRPTIDDTTAADGKRSLKVALPPDASVEVSSPLFSYNFGRTHVVSVWLKAAEPDTTVSLSLDGTDVGSSVQVGMVWKRYSFSGVLPYRPYTSLFLRLGEEAKARTVWIDGVQVEERTEPSPEYVPSQPLELALDVPALHPGHVVFDGEPGEVKVTVEPAPPAGARLHRTLVRWDSQRQSLPDVPLPRVTFALPSPSDRPRGVFKVEAQIVDAGGKPLSDMTQIAWARLPHPREIDPNRSYFGVHISLSPYYIGLARAVGARWVRLHDTSMIGKWAVAEPEPDQFQFYDEGVTAAHGGGLRVLGMLDGAPRRVSTMQREGYFGLWHIPDVPSAQAQWEHYVRTVTGHYKGRIDDWEVWNEPWGAWWTDSGNPNATPALYGKLLGIADRAAKEANPDARIVGVDTTRGLDKWTDGVLASSGTGDYDFLSFHDYNDALYGGPESLPQTEAQTFNAAQNKYGTAKPLWDTEGGLFGVGSFYAPQTGGMPVGQQPAYIVRYDVTMMGAGVQKFFLYAIHTDPMMGDISTVQTENDRAIRPLLGARAVLASLVDGAGRPTRTEPVKGVDCYAFPPQSGRIVRVLWSYDGAVHVLAPRPKSRRLDVFGNPLPSSATTIGPEPVYEVTR